jgi:GTP-binding protein
VDTGGIEPNTDDEMLLFIRKQVDIAIETADVVVLVADIRTGVTAADMDIANMLLRSKKPVVLAVNKMDSVGPADPALYEFYSLGLGEPIGVSALHGHGTGDLLDACLPCCLPRRKRPSRTILSASPSSAGRTSANHPWSTPYSENESDRQRGRGNHAGRGGLLF